MGAPSRMRLRVISPLVVSVLIGLGVLVLHGNAALEMRPVSVNEPPDPLPSPGLEPRPSPKPPTGRSPGPAPQPSPSGTGSPSSPGADGGTGDDSASRPGDDKKCDPLDYPCEIANTINSWFLSLARAAVKGAFGGMGENLIQTPEFAHFPRVQSVWRQSLVIADTCFVLLVIVGGLLLMGHETVQTSYSVKDVAPRLVVAFATAEFSDEIVEQSVHFANVLARALAGPGINPDSAARVLADRVGHHLRSGSIFLVILVLVAAFLACILAATYAIRVMVLMVLLVGGPLALACHTLPQTEAIARVWWRILVAVLLTQVVQSLVFLIAIEVLFTPDGSRAFSDNSQFWDMVLMICLLYVLVRVPVWVWHLVVQGGAPRSPVSRAGTYFYIRYQIGRAHHRFRGPAQRRGRGRARQPGGGRTPARPPRPQPYRVHPTYHQPPPTPSSAQPGWQPPPLRWPPLPPPRPASQPSPRPASGSASRPPRPPQPPPHRTNPGHRGRPRP